LYLERFEHEDCVKYQTNVNNGEQYQFHVLKRYCIVITKPTSLIHPHGFYKHE
jgi:hypothetical protein